MAKPKEPYKTTVFISGAYEHTKENVSQNLMLLKAMGVAKDPKKFQQIIRARAAVAVFQTMDKIALRREWHNALEKAGLGFDTIVEVLKNEMIHGKRGNDRINAAKIVLKSLGLEKYEDASIQGGSWEDEILRAADNATSDDRKNNSEYVVKVPQIPESVKKQRKEQNDLGKSLYE